jgi:hypothetical protein
MKRPGRRVRKLLWKVGQKEDTVRVRGDRRETKRTEIEEHMTRRRITDLEIEER